MLMWVMSCGNPPMCSRLCENLAQTCAYGDAATCEEACDGVESSNDQNFRVRDCLSVADCGHLAAQECSDLVENTCLGARLVAVSAPGCFEGVRTIAIAEDCSASPTGDWGELGTPAVTPDASGFARVAFTECALPLSGGSASCDCGTAYLAKVF